MDSTIIGALIGALIGLVGTIIAAVIGAREVRRKKTAKRGATQSFYILLERGALVSGRAAVFISGKHVGELAVEQGHLQALLTVKLPSEAKVQYEIRAKVREVVHDGNGREFVEESVRTGQGVITPKAGETIRLSLIDIALGGPAVGTTFLAALHQDESKAPPDLSSAVRELDKLMLALLRDPESFEDGMFLHHSMVEYASLFGSTGAEVEELWERDYTEGLIAKAIHERWVSDSVVKAYQRKS